MPRGGKRSTSFTSETAPKGRGASKHRVTKIKEAIGLSGWERLCEYIKNEGADKLVVEMAKLSGKDYINALSTLAEYVKPKLQRTTLVGDPDQPLQVNSMDNLSFEQLYQLKYGSKPE
jgi:hypothetical protein